MVRRLNGRHALVACAALFALALATTFAVHRPLALRWVLVGMVAILPLAYLVRNLPITGRAVLAGYRQLDPALEPALHHHDGVHGAGARTGDRFDGEAPVFEEGVEHAPREGAVGPAALEGERHGLSGARPGEAAGLARMASSAARHRAVPLEVPVMNHALVI